MRILPCRWTNLVSRNSTRTILLCLILISLCGVTIDILDISQGTLVHLGSDCVEELVYDFSTPNDDNMVDMLNFVCIQSNDNPLFVYRKHESGFSSYWYYGQKKYRLPAMSCGQEQKIITTSDLVYKATGTYRNRLGFHSFHIGPSNDNVPKGFTLSNDTAFFLGRTNLPFEPENLFHFIKQFFTPLYFMMTSTNNLNSKSRNVLFYHRPLGRCPSAFKPFNLDYAKPYLDLLNVADPYTSVFDDEDSTKPNKVCYKTAYFSSSRHLNRARDAIEYIKKSFGVTNAACNSTSKLLTFVARKVYRRVVNKGDLIQVAKSMGYDTKIAHLETMSQPEQAQLMQCTDVLVGVAGAGLQWAYFMKNYSGVIEIAWPRMQWPFFFSSTGWNGSSEYSEMNGVTQLSFAQLHARKCHHNPNAIRIYLEQIFKVKSPFTDEEALQILADPRNNGDYWSDKVATISKLCDVEVDPQKFRQALEKIHTCNNKKGYEW